MKQAIRTLHYRTPLGSIGFANAVLDELEHYDLMGSFPGPHVTFRLRRGTPEHRVAIKNYLHRRTYERWSKRLRQDKRRCDDCNRPVRKGGGAAPMMQDRVWLCIADRETWVCDRCVRRRLGRPIVMHDLVVCLFNMTQWRWVDGPRWRRTPAVNLATLPEGFWELQDESQMRLLKGVQALALHFDVPVAIMSTNIIAIIKRGVDITNAKTIAR